MIGVRGAYIAAGLVFVGVAVLGRVFLGAAHDEKAPGEALPAAAPSTASFRPAGEGARVPSPSAGAV
jgi:hypothetical protein